MATLEDLKPGIKVNGILPSQSVSVVDVKWHGSTAVELFYKHADGQPDTQLLYRDDEASIIVHPDRVVEPPELKKPIIPVEEVDDENTTEDKEPQKQVLSRYYGRVEINPKRTNKDMGLIVEEVIEHLTRQRNSRTLKFEHYGFEEE